MYEDEDACEKGPELSAYGLAIQLLAAGIQPYLIPIEDDLHVIATKPTDRESLSQLISPDGDTRDGYMVAVMKMVRHGIEEEAYT